MNINISSILLSVTFLLWVIRIIISRRKISKKELLSYFHHATDIVLGLYATVYVIYLTVIHIFDITPSLIKVDAALTVVLFYGGIHLLYPKILTFFRRQ